MSKLATLNRVTAIWTSYDENHLGQRSNYTCAHCSHRYNGFDYEAVILHCREKHPEFYQQMWYKEQTLPAPLLPAPLVHPKFHPKTV